MIADTLVWIGTNALTVGCFLFAAVSVGVIIYCTRDLPEPEEEDEHARNHLR